MTVTHTLIGTGITRRWSTSISAPMDGEEEVEPMFKGLG